MMVTTELLGTFPIFKSLPRVVLAQIAVKSELKKFSRRGIVLSAGEKEDAVCFLFEGRLQGLDFTIDGREVGLYFVEPGDFCGEIALFDREPQSEFVIARTAAVVVFVPIKEMQGVMLKTPEVMNVLGGKMASRVRQMVFQRSLLGLPNIGQRVCCQLWMLVSDREKARITRQIGSDYIQKAAEIDHPPTHMEIAIMLNVSRETVTRVFQTLQNRQIVRRDGSAKLIISNLEALRQFAEGTQDF